MHVQNLLFFVSFLDVKMLSTIAPPLRLVKKLCMCMIMYNSTMSEFCILYSQNSYARDSVEPAIKPGESALVSEHFSTLCVHLKHCLFQ